MGDMMTILKFSIKIMIDRFERSSNPNWDTGGKADEKGSGFFIIKYCILSVLSYFTCTGVSQHMQT
jgi:hypothetical protein